MKGDFTRDTFDPRKHYSGVRMQQGRVQLDADWNEQVDIANYHDATSRLDTLGPAGGPVGEAGFQIGIGAVATRGDLTIAPGRYYVDGILCENDAATSLTTQPDLLGLTPIAAAGLYVVYLDVWQRHIIYLDDPSIREVALGGPDTATRTKTVWQVKFLSVTDPGPSAACSSTFTEWNSIVAPSTGRLRARSRPAASSTDPCIVAASAGFRGLENQLYRVEIHHGGTFPSATPPTFKWSRENGSLAAEWLDQTGNVLKVSNTGRDGVLNFAPGQFIELIDDRRDLAGEPGQLVRIDLVDGQFLTVTGTVDRAQFPRNPRIRRWETPAPGAITVQRPAANDGYLALESGVEIRFEDGTYKNGDYWVLPARSVGGVIEWPLDGTNPRDLAPRGIVHRYSRLALVRFTAPGGVLTGTVVEDCRRLFPALADVNGLFYLGGDGQQVMPNPTLPAQLLPLAQPLRVGVANGLQNARVRFAVTLGGGRLQATGNPVEVVTDANRIAACAWELDSTTLIQQVEANLIDTAGKTVHLPIRFTASLSVAGQVAYNPAACANLAGQITVQAALDRLCQLVPVEPGFQVRRIFTTATADFLNDDAILVTRLVEGINVECTENVEPISVSRPTCFVTVDVPFVAAAAPVATGNATPQILGADVRATGSVINWIPNVPTRTWLLQVLPTIIAQTPGRRILGHFTLRGSFIWAQGRPDLLLDGEVFPRPTGTRTDIRLPSGDRRRGGDLDMWFWLTTPG